MARRIWLSYAGQGCQKRRCRANGDTRVTRTESRDVDDLGIAHVPAPVEIGDVLDLGHRPILLLRVVDLVETGPQWPLAALVKVSPAPLLVR